MSKLTADGIRALKGKRQLTETFTQDPGEAAAAAAAGIDVIVTGGSAAAAVRAAAPEVFLIVAPSVNFDGGHDIAIRGGLETMEAGADAIYCASPDMDTIAAMAGAGVLVIGHVGYVPARMEWTCGPRAFGKTAEEAVTLYRDTKAYEQAGAFGIEMELVADRVAAEINRRTSLFVISMGSGNGCDGQYVFAADILGTNPGHVPRHAKQYRNLSPEDTPSRDVMAEAFREFREDVNSGRYPGPEHTIRVIDEEYDRFQSMLD